MRTLSLVCAISLLVGCGESLGVDAGTDAARATFDATIRDSGAPLDGGARDSGSRDSGPRTDAGEVDAALADAGGSVDAATPTDGDVGCTVPPARDGPIECFQECLVAEDCVYVDTGCCCGCAMGGSSIAIHEDNQELYEERMDAMCTIDCSDVFCIGLYNCPEEPPGCNDGRCTVGGGITAFP